MKADVIESLRSILDYLHDDEKKDWEATGKPDGHYYLDVIKVTEWLDS